MDDKQDNNIRLNRRGLPARKRKKNSRIFGVDDVVSIPVRTPKKKSSPLKAKSPVKSSTKPPAKTPSKSPSKSAKKPTASPEVKEIKETRPVIRLFT